MNGDCFTGGHEAAAVETRGVGSANVDGETK